MNQAAPVLALVIVVQLCAGCATIVTGGGEDQAVRFASTPRGATVYVDDNPVGQTPISVRLTRKDEHKVRMEYPGYRAYERTIGSGFNEWMLGNVVIGGLIGLGVDLLSGANPALDTNNINAQMIKEESAVAGVSAPAQTRARPAAYLNASSSAPPPPAAARRQPAPRYSRPPAYAPPPVHAAPPPPAGQSAPAAPAPAGTGTYKGW